MALSGGGIPLLVDRTADVATNSETQVLLRSVENPDLRIVMTVAEGHYRIVARRSAGIRRVGGSAWKESRRPGEHVGRVLPLEDAADGEARRTGRHGRPDARGRHGRRHETRRRRRRRGLGARRAGRVAALGDDAIVFQDPKVYRELFNLNTTAGVLGDPAKRRVLVDVVRAIAAASRDVRARPADVRPLLSSRINVPQATIATVWRHFRFPTSLPPDILDVLVEEEQWVAARQKRSPRARAQLQSLIDDSVLREATKVGRSSALRTPTRTPPSDA